METEEDPDSGPKRSAHGRKATAFVPKARAAGGVWSSTFHLFGGFFVSRFRWISETCHSASFEPCLERTHLQNHRLTEKIEVSFDDDADQMEVEPEGPMDQWTNGWNGGLS